MAYGLWLYKEIQGKHLVRLEIKKRDYQGQAIEIDALGKDSITLSMDGSNITDPIIGSTLSFSIIDSDQINTSDFFTPDATLYAVELYLDGILHWSGYLTPDSYAENLSYRDTISLIARDNLGRLNDFTFEVSRGLMNIEELFESLLDEVECSQYLNWSVDKVATAKGNGVSQVTDIRNMSVNTMLFVGQTYREVMESILSGLGCQMRFRGSNNLLILNLSDLSTIQEDSAIFIEKSGRKEILPAWKKVTITQDYGLIENFFDGVLTEKESGSSTFYNPSEQVPTKWEGNLNFQNQYGWNTGIEDNQQESIYPVLREKSSSLLSGDYRAIYKTPIKATNVTLSITMSLNNTLRRLRNVVFNSVSNLFIPEGKQSYELTFGFQVALRRSNGVEYIMTPNDWVEITTNPFHRDYVMWIKFQMPECVMADEGTWNKEQEVSIFVNSIPYDGELLLYIYPVLWGEDVTTDDGYSLAGKIRDIKIAFSNDIGQQSARATINDKHNITSEIALTIGQVPSGKGDYRAYAGGLFSADGLPIYAFKRREEDIISYNLMELVAREHIHYNKDNYTILSGRMMGDISLGNNIAYKGRKYTLISASYSVISGILDVTSMQEVRDYQVAELTIIDSPLESTSGSRVGSGNNEVIQFSSDAGNAKRLYELQDAAEQDQEGAFIIIDKSSMDSAKKLPISAISSELNKAFKVHYNSDGTIKSIEALANLWTNFGITAGGEGTGSGGGTGGATSLEGLNDVSLSALVDGQYLVWSSTLNKWINKAIESGLDEDALSDYLLDNNYAVKGDIPSALKSPYKLSFGDKSYDGSAEVTITAADLGAITEHQDISHLLSKDAAAATYQVKGNYLTGITSKMVTDALTYTPLANTTKYALSDSVGGDALNSAKLGGQLPTYYATAASVTNVADDLSEFKTLFDSMFEKKDGKIHAKLTLWTDYALVAGGEGDGTGGGGGGLTAFSVIINNKTYNSDNGTATITEQLQPLITASNKLDYSLISGTPTSLPASDVYDWAKKSSLAASDVPNLDWSKITSGKPTTLAGYGITDALPLSGGTIYSGKHNPLNIKGNATYASISFTLDKTTYKSYLLYKGGTNWSITSENWGEEHTLIHSGNIGSQSVASATKLQTARTIWGQSFDGTGNITGNITLTNADQINGNWGIAINVASGGLKDTSIWNGQGVENVRFKSNGNVLIGTTTDNGAKLYVNSGDYNILHLHRNLGSGYGTAVYCSNNNGFLGIFGFNQEDDFIVVNGGYSSTSALFRVSSNTITLNTKANLNDAALIYKGTSSFATLHITNVTSSIDYSHIFVSNADSSRKDRPLVVQNGYGNVGIGVTNPTSKLQVNGNISASGQSDVAIYTSSTETSTGANTTGLFRWGRFDENTGGFKSQFGGDDCEWQIINKAWNKALFIFSSLGNFTASGAIAAGTASDIRLKDSILTIDQNKAIEVIMALNPITYQWNNKARELGGYEGISQGFIAQEYESIIPNSGRMIWGEYRAIDYTKAIPYIVSVEQNHETRIRQLEEELNRLRREYYGI
jgi:hypothetical protein